MATFRLYRDFIKVVHDPFANTNTNVSINPYSLSAFTSGDTSIVESFSSPINESTGRYYVEMNLQSYDYTITFIIHTLMNNNLWLIIKENDDMRVVIDEFNNFEQFKTFFATEFNEYLL